jgi:hypothetical protein
MGKDCDTEEREGGDRYTGLGKALGTKIQREFTHNQQKEDPKLSISCTVYLPAKMGAVEGWGGSIAVFV